MNGGGFTPLPAGGARFNPFERRHRQAGGSSRSYSEHVSTPPHVAEQRKFFWTVMALCALVPPVGIYLLWRGGVLILPLRVAATAAAFVILSLVIYWIMPQKTPDTVTPAKYAPGAVTEYSPSSAAQTGGEGAQ